ncbi:hypothetical protein Aperf_G00000019117 [Anoplocephala perfoliata]
MGSSVSSFSDNESLVDSLLETNDFPPNVERVLRLVDRGHYAIEPKSQIYSDCAWRVEKLHLSAPGIYATALNELNIKPGHSVLNIGSGTGYLSTMFGLLLGSNGVNHGIELHASNVDFALKCLENFMAKSDAVYERDFCPPQFIVGNIFSVVRPSQDEEPSQLSLLTPFVHIDPPPRVKTSEDTSSKPITWPTYDRIYVGSMITSLNQLTAILRLLNVGGKLVAPIQDELHKIERVTETSLNDTVLSNVSFVNLVLPSEDEPDVFPPPKRQVESLERLACRCFRAELRRLILERKGALPTLGRYVKQPLPPDSPTPSTSTAAAGITASSRNAAAASDTSITTSPQASASIPPSHSSQSPSSSGPSSSSPGPTASGVGVRAGGEDELEGVAPFVPPHPPPSAAPPTPPRPPPQRRLIGVTITPGGDVDGEPANAEHMDFIEMISRNFLYCRMLLFTVSGSEGERNALLHIRPGPLPSADAHPQTYKLTIRLPRNQQRSANQIEEESEEDEEVEDSSTSETSASSTNASDNSEDDEDENTHAMNLSVLNENKEVSGEGEGDGKASTVPGEHDIQVNRQQRRRRKRRRREDGTEEAEEEVCGDEEEAEIGHHGEGGGGTRRGGGHRRRRQNKSSSSSKQKKVWDPPSYTFREEMRLLLEEVKRELNLTDYPGELVLKII